MSTTPCRIFPSSHTYLLVPEGIILNLALSRLKTKDPNTAVSAGVTATGPLVMHRLLPCKKPTRRGPFERARTQLRAPSSASSVDRLEQCHSSARIAPCQQKPAHLPSAIYHRLFPTCSTQLLVCPCLLPQPDISPDASSYIMTPANRYTVSTAVVC